MRVVVTGGAGYKGAKLSQRLLEAGHDVLILDNFMYGFEPVLHLLAYRNLSIIPRDVRINDYSYLRSADAIFHLAGISGYPACEANPHSARLINVDATRQIVKRLSKDQYLIYASTTSLYGQAAIVCSEDTPVDPVSVYGATKLEAERIAMDHPKSIALRFATVFGTSTRMRVDLLVNDFVYRAMTERVLVLYDCLTKRTFIHIDDAIHAYVFALEHVREMAGYIYNVGGGHLNLSKLDIAHAIKEVVVFDIVDSKVRDLDVRDFIISFARIEKLGFKTTLTLRDGIRDLVRLYGFYRPFSHFRTI